MAASEYVKLALTLPPRLLRFFARYPPPALTKSAISSSSFSTAPTTSSSDPNASQIETAAPPLPYTNPFFKTKHAMTGSWHDPKFSLRQQADLCKIARTYGVENLLPPSTKASETRLQRRIEKGVRVRGTGVGQKVKGRRYERTMRQRLEGRRQAMLKMPQLVQQWRQVSQTAMGMVLNRILISLSSWVTEEDGRSFLNDRIDLALMKSTTPFCSYWRGLAGSHYAR